MVIAEAEKDEEVVVSFVPLDVFDQCRAGWPFRLEPRQFIAQRMLAREHLLRPFCELDRITFRRDRKTVNGDAVYHLLAFGQLVLPRDVVAMRAGRQDLDFDMLRQVLGDIPRMLFGAAVDIGAVALNNNRDLHCRSSSESESGLRCESWPDSSRRSS